MLYTHSHVCVFGTVLNIVAILAGSALGILAGNKLSERTRNLMTDVLGAITLVGAASAIAALWKVELIDALPQGWPLLVVLSSLLIGGLLGSLLKIEAKLENLGVRLKRRFDKDGSSPFVEGFVSASLIFAIGPLAILGSRGKTPSSDYLALRRSLHAQRSAGR